MVAAVCLVRGYFRDPKRGEGMSICLYMSFYIMREWMLEVEGLGCGLAVF